jgi:hypothetical protein
MADGVVLPRTEGTPQGGPLSPLLSNILLTDLDRELERRGHAFCRYADDCNIYVRSQQAGERVMASLTRFLADTLKAHGQCGQERGGGAKGEEVSGLQPHVAQGPETEDRADQLSTAGRQNPGSTQGREGASPNSTRSCAAGWPISG